MARRACLASIFQIVQHAADMVPKSEKYWAAQLTPVLWPTTSRRRHPKPDDVPGVATTQSSCSARPTTSFQRGPREAPFHAPSLQKRSAMSSYFFSRVRL